MSEERSKIMDNLIAQDADLIDFPLVAAVRELLTDDSVEHLGVFTHNLVQALDKHGLKVVSKIYIDWQNDTIRECKDEINDLRYVLREVFEEYAGSEGFIPETAPEGYLLQLTKRMADIARAALGETE